MKEFLVASEYEKYILDYYRYRSKKEFYKLYEYTYIIRDISLELYKIQEVLKNPLKYFKDPYWSFLTISVLKDSLIEVYLETVDYYNTNPTYYKISKDSIEEVLRKKYFEELKRYFAEKKL